MNEHGKNHVDLEQAEYRVRFKAEFDRQFAALPQADRDLITADPCGMLAEGLQIRVDRALSSPVLEEPSPCSTGN